MEKKPLLPKALKSFLKILVSAMIGQMVVAAGIAFSHNANIFTWDITVWQMIGSAGAGAALLVWKNWKDPKFPLYGEKPKEDIVIDNPAVAGSMQTNEQ